MASLFRPTRPYPLPPAPDLVDHGGRAHVRLTEGGRRVLYPVTKDGTKYLKPSRKWYGKYVNAAGVVRRVPLSANKAAAQQMLAELVRKRERERAGLHDPFEAHARTPLANHLADWEVALRAGGAGDSHVRTSVRSARRVLSGTSAVFPADLSASRVQRFVAGLRDDRPPLPPLDPGKEVFTKAEVAAALGVGLASVPSLVRRHRLRADGNGRARRYPRATVEALRGMRGRGLSVRTVNIHLAAIKAFVAWLVRDRRAADNPLAYLSGGNVRVDRRHDRRPLTADELVRLVRAAGSSPDGFRGLSGPDRAVLYAVTASTGFRAREMSTLTPPAFELDTRPATVVLAAKDAKNGKAAIQPLQADLAELLRGYLRGRPADAPVWPGMWYRRASEMIRRDQDVAGIPYVVQAPDGPRYADFHGLRHTFISLLDRSGATLKEAMQLARHSDPKLTMAVYGRARLEDLGAAIARLPSIIPAKPEAAGADVPPDVPPSDGGCQEATEDENRTER